MSILLQYIKKSLINYVVRLCERSEAIPCIGKLATYEISRRKSAPRNDNNEINQSFLNKRRKCTFRLFAIAAVASAFFFLNAHVAGAFGVNQCAADRKTSNLGCSAADVSITGISVAPGGPTKCVGGTSIPIDLDLTVNFAVPDRWDIGIFIVQDGKDPLLLSAGGGAAMCSVGILPTPTILPGTPFLDLDPGPWGGIADVCGDGNGAINGGTGTGILRMNAVPVTCKAVSLSNGKLYVPFVVSWDNQSSPSGATCTSNLDPVPNTTSKCNSPNTSLGTDVQYGTVALVVLPSITKTDGIAIITAGDTVNYTVVITNTTGAILPSALFKDPAVTNLTANSVVCAAAGGATCPASPTVAQMQGSGITILNMPVAGSVTFTVNATLNVAAPAGTLTNTATVTVQTETNSVSDTDTVLAKLGVTKVFAPFSILAGETSVLSVTLGNTNAVATAGTAFTDTYPAGLVNAAPPGVTNTCGGVVTAVAGGGSLSLSGGVIPAVGSCVITVTVISAVQAFYTNTTGNVTTTNGFSGNSATGYLAVGVSSLLMSTKTWVDMNGGEADPGDTIRYTIAITEIAGVAAVGVTVTDTVPATLTGMTVVTCPGGATCNVAGQTLTAANINITANGSVTLVFDVTIAPGTPASTQIDNCAVVANPGGGGDAPCAATIIVSPSAVPGTGNKPLYFYDGTSVPAYKLSRAKPAPAPAAVTIARSNSRLWTLNPALVLPDTIGPSVSPTIPVNLYLTTNTASESRTVTVSLVCSGGGTTFTQTKIFDGTVLNNPFLPTAAPVLVTFQLPLGAKQLCAATQTWNLTVANGTAGGGTRNILVYSMSAGNYSYASLPSLNVINVDSVNACNAPCNATCANACVNPPYIAGATVYVRAKVSDPFGAYDINASPPGTLPTVTIVDSALAPVVVSAAMTEKASAATTSAKWFEYTYTPVPVAGPGGFWTVTVTAKEGTENTVSDSGVGAFDVSIPPLLMIMKTVQTISDPISIINPKAIPGATMLYTVYVQNSGYGPVDSGTTAVTDAIPANTAMCVSNICSIPPVAFACSVVPPCGLIYNYATNVTYSSAAGGGAPFTYAPIPDGAGYDAAVTGVRMNPSGALAGSGVAPYPNFSLFFKVRIK